MSEYIVFFGGIAGVFIGMALIYASIKITASILSKMSGQAAEEKK